MTFLELSRGLFVHPFAEPSIPAGLLHLGLHRCCYSNLWIDSLLPHLTRLTKLELDSILDMRRTKMRVEEDDMDPGV